MRLANGAKIVPLGARAMTQVCASSASIGGKLKFGPFELSSRERMLRHEGVVLLGRRSLDILI